MTKSLITLAFISGVLVATGVQAKDDSQVTVSWGDMKDFRDVRPASETRGGYHDRIQRSFEKHFKKLASELPKDANLGIKINDMDLAGDVEFGTPREVRVLKDIHFPRIEFSYILTQSGTLVDKGDVSLKDMSYLSRMRHSRSNAEFYHDKRMISEWFEDTLLPMAQKSK